MAKVHPITLPALVIGALLVTTVAGAVDKDAAMHEDELYSDTHVFDELTGLILRKEDLGRHVASIGTGTHQFLEAERMFGFAGWVAAPARGGTAPPRQRARTCVGCSGLNLAMNNRKGDAWTIYPATWPLFHTGAVARAGTSDGVIYTPPGLTAKTEGPHKVWVRYIHWQNDPAPIVVTVIQGGAPVATAVMGTEPVARDDPRLGEKDPHGFITWRAVDAALKRGPFEIRLEKQPDDGAAGDRIVDSVYVTSDTNYVPRGRSQLSDRTAMRHRADALLRGGVAMWPADPWGHWDIHDWPRRDRLGDRIDLIAARGEKVWGLMRITSLSTNSQRWRIVPGPLVGANGKAHGPPDIRVVAFMESARYGWVPHLLMRRQRLGLAPFHTGALWIEVATGSLPAGTYEATVRLEGDDTRFDFRVHLNVLDIEPGDEPDFWRWVWGGPPRAPEGIDRTALYLKDLRDHGCNFLYSYAPADHPLVRQLGFVAFNKTWGTEDLHERRDYDSEAFDQKAAEVVRHRTEQRAAALTPGEHFYVDIFDEPKDPTFPHWAKVAAALKKHAPDLKLAMNPDQMTPAGLEIVKPYVDSYAPQDCIFWQSPQMVPLMKETGKRVMMFSHYVGDSFSPIKSWSWFRRQSWVAWKYGVQGCGFYCYSCYRHNPYDPIERWAVVWPGTRGPIPSRNWKAWLAGIQDHALLTTLDRAITNAESSGRPADAARARAALEAAVTLGFESASSADYAAARQMIVDALLWLR